MINTGKIKVFGQIEDQAAAGDIEAFVFRNGEVVPASQAENSTGPVIHTAPEKNYGQMEDIANGNSNVEAFVFREGNVVPANQVGNGTGPVIHTPPEKNYGQVEYIFSCMSEEDIERFTFRSESAPFICEKVKEVTNPEVICSAVEGKSACNSCIQVIDEDIMPFKFVDGKVELA